MMPVRVPSLKDHVVGGEIVVVNHLVLVRVRIRQGPVISCGLREGFGYIVKGSQHPGSGTHRAVGLLHVARDAAFSLYEIKDFETLIIDAVKAWRCRIIV